MADRKGLTVSGFCAIGHCEGTKPKGAMSGDPMKTCVVLGCGCKCHKDIDKMFEMMGMERVLQQNPDYRPPKRTWWMPSDDPNYGISSSNTPASPPVIIESLAPDIVPATVARPFDPTPSGRAARGQLEFQVKEACDLWAVLGSTQPCTPSWISEWIAVNHEIKHPSQGAINSVLERWVGLGFAEVGKKPTRFIKYTEDGVKLGLEVMKARAKQRARQGQAAINRGEKRT